MGRLEERVIIVTGGAHGIGRAYCEGLAREGVRVVVAGGREHLDAFLESLHITLAGFVAILLAGLAVLVRLSLAAGLEPVERLVAKLRGLDAESLGEGIEEAGTPRELEPVVDELKEVVDEHRPHGHLPSQPRPADPMVADNDPLTGVPIRGRNQVAN